MLMDLRAQDNYRRRLLLNAAFLIEVGHAGDLSAAVGVDAEYLRVDAQVEVPRIKRDRDRRKRRRQLGLRVAPEAVALPAVGARGPLGDALIVRGGRLVALGRDGAGSRVGVVAQPPAGVPEQLVAGALADRRHRVVSLPGPFERVRASLAGHAHLPFELFVVRLQVVVAYRPIDDVRAVEVRAGPLGDPAEHLVRVQAEVARHEPCRAASPHHEAAAEVEVAPAAALLPQRVLAGVVLERLVWACLEADDAQARRGELLGHDAADAPHAHQTNISLACHATPLVMPVTGRRPPRPARAP